MLFSAFLLCWCFFSPLCAFSQNLSIVNNNYTLEIFQGPIILSSNRMTSLGGAVTASPEGVEGGYANAAAPAVRDPFSFSWWDCDGSIGLMRSGAFKKTNFDNSSLPSSHSTNFNNFFLLGAGGGIQLGSFGVSAIADLQQVAITPERPEDSPLSLRLVRWVGLIAHALEKEQLVIGGGIRGITVQLMEGGLLEHILMSVVGFAPQFGFLVKPNDQPWRVGATFRAPIDVANSRVPQEDKQELSPVRVGRLLVPRRVVVPYELEIGIAFQLGPRPLNPLWTDPRREEAEFQKYLQMARMDTLRQDALLSGASSVSEEERKALAQWLYQRRKARYEKLARSKLLLLMSTLVTGASDGVVSVQGLLDQNYDQVGRKVVVSPRLGLEGEPISNYFRLRMGSYLEPSRFSAGRFRPHVTGGGDLKLIKWDAFSLFRDVVWRVTFSVDVASEYFNWGVGIGAWH
ncbi:hypothetical protein BCY86_03925 [Pajaroellobacter abortibovis]|uniref:Bacterial surface antigen (D15) domain-containing protein n=1 Tax=Pajaroellobacter abortibovis TaxID=1882918 RepID=A0A1L6MWI8_9BACT|nr:hypothetical protein BCY86_03925 [Pajaroellobacter abortibovis]